MANDTRQPERLRSPPSPKDPPEHGYRVVSSGCQYCVVGCGYKVHLWDAEHPGTSRPPDPTQGMWVSPAMAGRVHFCGKEMNAAVVPDPRCVMNKGNHSIRGGTQGRNLVHSVAHGPAELASTRERLTTPLLRTKSGFVPISNQEADALLLALVKAATGHAIRDGKVEFSHPGGLGAKLYEYQYLENTFAATTLLFQLIGTPNVAFHDRPSVANNTAPFDDSGINPHGYAYADIADSDVLLLVGSNPVESQSVFFMQYMAGRAIIVIDPRRTATADYAVRSGGLHLQPAFVGADPVVLGALAAYILERQQERPSDWPARTPTELLADVDAIWKAGEEAGTVYDIGKVRRALSAVSFEEYKQRLLTASDKQGRLYTLDRAESVSGICSNALRKCAEMLAGPCEGLPAPDKRRVSIIFEKGLIWGFNSQNLAAVANLGLLLGSVLRPGGGADAAPYGVTGRAGGHQKGWAEVAYQHDGGTRGYPFHNAVDEWILPRPIGGKERVKTFHYFDAHLVGRTSAQIPKGLCIETELPDIRLLWAIGCNPVGQVANAAEKWAEVDRRRGSERPADVNEAMAMLTARIAANGLVVVQQDIYPNPTTMHADLVLPAKGWGEEDFCRYTGERRLRLYGRFQDAPRHRLDDGTLETDTRCRADWEIFRKIAGGLLAGAPGASVNGLDLAAVERWTDSAAVFGDMARRSNRTSWLGDLEKAGETGHARLSARGSNGYVIPIKLVSGGGLDAVFEESDRVRVDSRPYTFVWSDWLAVSEHFDVLKPRHEDEFVVVNGRVNETWNSMFTNIRNATIRERWPDDMPGTIVELHPDDARRHGLSNGDVVEIVGTDIPLGATAGSFLGVASIAGPAEIPSVRPGMLFAMFSYPATSKDQPPDPRIHRAFNSAAYVNNITTGYVDPANPIAAVKYARGTIRKTGERYSQTLLGPTYLPRNLTIRHSMAHPATKADRARWRLREFIVQKGLPRRFAPLYESKHAALTDPDHLAWVLVTDIKQRNRILQLLGFQDGGSGEPGDGWMHWEAGEADDFSVYDTWTRKEKLWFRDLILTAAGQL